MKLLFVAIVAVMAFSFTPEKKFVLAPTYEISCEATSNGQPTVYQDLWATMLVNIYNMSGGGCATSRTSDIYHQWSGNHTTCVIVTFNPGGPCPETEAVP